MPSLKLKILTVKGLRYALTHSENQADLQAIKKELIRRGVDPRQVFVTPIRDWDGYEKDK